MSERAKPWTKAIEAALSGGGWCDVSEVIEAGAAVVDDARASEEASRRNSGASAKDEERRLASAKRTVASQSLMGMRRFGKVEMSTDKKKVRAVSDTSQSLGGHADRIAALEARVSTLTLLVGKLARGESLVYEQGSVTEAEAAVVAADTAQPGEPQPGEPQPGEPQPGEPQPAMSAPEGS